jgi:hypothetical protein
MEFRIEDVEGEGDRHKLYCKPTHTNLYLNAKSHHHPSNKQVVLSTLIHRVRALCDEDSLQAELVFLKDVFEENGYNDRQIHRALNPVRTYLNRTMSPTQSPSCPLSELYSIL